ncbi:MAG: cell division protein ZapA [Saccharofermentanales bacterium]
MHKQIVKTQGYKTMKDQTPKSKKISVSIGGVTYHLVSHENETYMKAIAAQADEIISRIAAGNPSLSGMQGHVLAIINLVDALTRKTEEHDQLKSESAKLSVRAAAAEKELFDHRDDNFEIKKEAMRVSELNRQLMLEIASLRGRAVFAGSPEKDDDAVAEADIDPLSAARLLAAEEFREDEEAEEAEDFGAAPKAGTDTGTDTDTGIDAETEELTAVDEYFKDDEWVENAEFARIDEPVDSEEIPDMKKPQEKDYLAKQGNAETDYSESSSPKEYEYYSDIRTEFPSDDDAPAVTDSPDTSDDPSRYGEFTQPSLDEYLPSSR